MRAGCPEIVGRMTRPAYRHARGARLDPAAATRGVRREVRMSSQDLPVLHDHGESPYSTASCYNCRFGCGSLVSRVEKGHGDTFQEVLQRRLSRRGLLKASLVVTAAAALGPQ